MSVLDKIKSDIDSGKLALFGNPNRKHWYVPISNEYIRSVYNAMDILVNDGITTQPLVDLLNDLKLGMLAIRRDYQSTESVGKFVYSASDINELEGMLNLSDVKPESVNTADTCPIKINDTGVITTTDNKPVFLNQADSDAYYKSEHIKNSIATALGDASPTTGTYTVSNEHVNGGQPYDVFVWVDADDNSAERNGTVWVQLMSIPKAAEQGIQMYWETVTTGVKPLMSNSNVMINRLLLFLKGKEFRFITYKDTGNVFDIANPANRGVDFITGTRDEHPSFIEALCDIKSSEYTQWKDYYRYGIRLNGTRDPKQGYKNAAYDYMRIWDGVSDGAMKNLADNDVSIGLSSASDSKFSTHMTSNYSGQDATSSQTFGADDGVVGHWNIGDSNQSTATETIQFTNYFGAVFIKLEGINECI